MPSKQYWIKDGNHDGGYADMPGTPLYPFGYGLTYTDFKYSDLRITPDEISKGREMQVRVDVTNAGARPGVETVQLYMHERYTPVATPVKQLRGFDRVELNPGETKTVVMKLRSEDLLVLDINSRWKLVPGIVDIMIGKSSEDIVLSGTLRVTTQDSLTGEKSRR
jgi:beta-glucosidase